MSYQPRSNVVPALVAIVAFIAATVLALPLLFAGTALSDTTSSARSEGVICATSGPIAGLSDASAANARTIAAVASARGGGRAALIVLAVGIAESGLRQLGNVADVTPVGLQSEGLGSDHDSVGIFQQRAGWGTAQQRLDPVASTDLLLDRLLATPDWDKQQPWLIAQTVHVSAFDGMPRPANNFSSDVGGNYRASLAEARRVLTIIQRDAKARQCDGGSGVGTPPAGRVGPYGLPVAFLIPNTTSQPARTAVTAALGMLGRPYVFGAAGPETFDCSGLTMWAWAQAGISLPHYTVRQWDAGTPTDAAHLSPGDLVLIPGSDGTLADPQHVGMFIGSGLVIEAPETGDVVKVVTYDSFVSAGLSGLRHIA